MRRKARKATKLIGSAMAFTLFHATGTQVGNCQAAPAQTTAQITAQTATQTPDTAPASFSISPGDLITLDVFNPPELSGHFRVDKSGVLHLPQGGDVNVAGLSAVQAGIEIERQFRDGQIMLDPHVTVFIQEYAQQGVIVLGEVRSPGTYNLPLLNEHTLYGALAAAGGATPNQGPTITITHAGDPVHKEVIQVTSPNFSEAQHTAQVRPGDTVFVSHAPVFYVVGNVGRPGTYPITAGQTMKVLQAIALAEGTQRATADNKAAIIRITENGPKTIPLHIKKIYKNEEPDQVLQAQDILVIPRSGLLSVLDTAAPGASAALVSALIDYLILR